MNGCTKKASDDGEMMKNLGFAVLTIVLWSSLASLMAALKSMPPFLLTGLGLLLGGLLLAPTWRQWRLPWRVLVIGSAALFFYHAALFTALKWAPAVSANLINYLWPLFIVVLAPLFDRQQTLTPRTIIAALTGFVGAALAIAGGQSLQIETQAWFGYGLALIAALIWSNYTLMLRRLPPFPSAAVGAFSIIAGLLALLVSGLSEARPTIDARDVLLLLLTANGPLGVAFYCWDRAAKNLASQTLGVLSFITPVLSTSLLVLSSGNVLTPLLLFSAILVLTATALVMWPVKSAR